MSETAEHSIVPIHIKAYVFMRLLGTALIFTCISLGGLLMSITIFPAISLFSFNKEKKHQRVQKTLHYTFRIVIFLMKMLCLVRLNKMNWHNIEKNQNGRLFISNHPTLIDYVYLVSIFPQLDCIVKAELWDSFFLSGVVKAAGYIKADNPQEFTEDCLKRLEKGRSILIFPEGTRSLPDQLRSFKKGAASVIMSSTCKVYVLTIKCTPPILMKGQKWNDIPPKMATLSIEAFSELSREAASKGETKAIKARSNINKYLRNFIESHL